MENEILKQKEGNTIPLKIYSKKAIFGFSVCFTTVFGGFLLMQNLKDLGKKKEGNIVLIFSILYTTVSIILINLISSNNTTKTYIFNVFGGVLLGHYFFTKYIPNEEEYETKAIWKPLIISILITIPFIWALLYSLKNTLKNT